MLTSSHGIYDRLPQVSDVEEMVERANRSAQAVQVRLVCLPACAPSTQPEQGHACFPGHHLSCGKVRQLTARTSLPSLPPPHRPQAEYQAEKLRVFPHINSPARLIRELVRPAAAPAVAAAAASPGGKAQQGATAAAADGKENAMEA